MLVPPQTTISLPVHTAVLRDRAAGAPVVLVAVQLSVLGLYRPPVLSTLPLVPPQTIISLPVQTAVCCHRAAGAFVRLVGAHVSVQGEDGCAQYLPPVFK